MPLVSTLICTYNAANFIDKTLTSVVGQSYQNQEILIRDDGSTDATTNILSQWKKKDKRITIFASQEIGKKLGPYGGLNFLMEKTKGKYIAIQDHDDIWHSTKLEIQIDFLEKNTQYIGAGTGALIYYGVQKVGYLYDMVEKDAKTVMHTSLVFRNQGFRYDTSIDFLVDSYFMKNILSNNKNILKIIPQPLILHYLKGNGSNYSELRFSINKKNIKIFFNIYGYKPYSIFMLFYISFCKLLPVKWKNSLDFYLIRIIKQAKPKESLESSNKLLEEMLKNY